MAKRDFPKNSSETKVVEKNQRLPVSENAADQAVELRQKARAARECAAGFEDMRSLRLARAEKLLSEGRSSGAEIVKEAAERDAEMAKEYRKKASEYDSQAKKLEEEVEKVAKAARNTSVRESGGCNGGCKIQITITTGGGNPEVEIQ